MKICLRGVMRGRFKRGRSARFEGGREIGFCSEKKANFKRVHCSCERHGVSVLVV